METRKSAKNKTRNTIVMAGILLILPVFFTNSELQLPAYFLLLCVYMIAIVFNVFLLFTKGMCALKHLLIWIGAAFISFMLITPLSYINAYTNFLIFKNQRIDLVENLKKFEYGQRIVYLDDASKLSDDNKVILYYTESELEVMFIMTEIPTAGFSGIVYSDSVTPTKHIGMNTPRDKMFKLEDNWYYCNYDN